MTIRRLKSGKPWRTFKAKFDTGATTSRVGRNEAKILGLGPPIDTRRISTGNGYVWRKVVRAKIIIGDHRLTTEFTVSRKAGVNIGCNTMGAGFQVRPSRDSMLGPKPG